MERLTQPQGGKCRQGSRWRRLPAGLSALVLTAFVHAGDVAPHAFVTATPVDNYRKVTQQELVSCGAAMHAVLKQSHPAEDGERGCIAIGRHVCRLDYEAALQAVRRPDAREALKAYHSAFVTALDGIAPVRGEPRDGYERRQQLLQHLMAHAWTRFELAE